MWSKGSLFNSYYTEVYVGGGYSIPWIASLTIDPYLTAKQGGIQYHFLSLWYDLTLDWTPAFQTIGKHFLTKNKKILL